MSENPTTKGNTAVTEAPASWNTKYTSPEGFICQITLRAESGKELLEKAQAAMTYLLQAGCIPCDNLTFRPRSNGNGNGNGAKPKTDNGSNGSHAEEPGKLAENICPIHKVEMKRWEKNGKIWYSHKLDDGGWCNGGKAK